GVMPEFNRDSLRFIKKLARDYGDIVSTRFFYVPAYFLYHPDHIEYVLATNNRNFIKPLSFRTPFFQRLVGNGLLTSEGEFWRRQRRLAQPAFHRERIANYARVMVKDAEKLAALWRDGEILDVHREMMRLTMEIVTHTLFNVDVTDDADKVARALSVLVEPFGSQATLKWILDNRLPTPTNRRFHKVSAQLDEVVYRIIRERRAGGSKDQGDLLSMLLQAHDEDGSQMTDQQLRDEVITLFLAGQETTALTLTWAWYLLAQHPEVEKKLWEELDDVLGDREPEAADYPCLKLTEMIVKESMRLYPPAYIVGREAVGECEIGGYHVPPKMQIFMPTWVVHRDARFYDEPDEFRPERWTPEFTNNLPKYAYFPFGGGPRVCIGNAFAMMEIVLVLATLARKFQLKLVTKPPAELVPAMSLRPRNGIRVMLERR
ncbi:MAG TPA: cytochrome P450, partial [Pyrinomonadaceae bacterium]|nr:cytochrome P450 [Pyrinomonadaceae bacterium]